MPRNRGGKEDADASMGREWSYGLLKMLALLIVFVAGVVIGLASSSRINRYFMWEPKPTYFIGHVPAVTHTLRQNSMATVSLCEEKVNCFSMEDFLHPKNLTHDLSDKQLFWRASLVPERKDYPYDKIPKVAFMFLTRGPLPMLRLWENFFRGHDELFSIYIHAPPGYKLNVSTTSVFYGRHIPSKEVQWGRASLFDGERRLLANALLDFSNERFVLLSESCIPVCGFLTVYNYLVNSAHSFVESYDDPSRYGRGRYSRSMSPDIRLTQWRKGSQWFELHRPLAVAVVSDAKYYALFVRYCRPSCYTDEHYLPTFLGLFYASRLANRTVTWVDWSRGGPHPVTFGSEDVTEGFVRSIRENDGTPCRYNSANRSLCFLFARKFSLDSVHPLLHLGSMVMGF